MNRDYITTALNDYISEALQLRLLTELPTVASTITAVQECLLDIRGRQDRIEELLRRAVRVRAHAQRVHHAAQAAADDAWDQAAVQNRNAPVQRGDEYSSARERHAEANLAVLDLRHAARQAAELAHICDEAVEVIRITHRGLDNVRHDIRELLRTYTIESHLER